MLNRLIMQGMGNRSLALKAAAKYFGSQQLEEKVGKAQRRASLLRVLTFPISLGLLAAYAVTFPLNLLFLLITYWRIPDKASYRRYHPQWRKLAEHWKKMPCNFMVKATELSLYHDHAPKDLSHSLEVGVYTGETSRAFFLGQKFDVGMEYNIERLFTYRRGDVVHNRLLSADVREMPFPTGRFNSVFCVHSIDDMEFEARAAIQEMSRVLAPGGRLVFSGATENYTRFNLLIRLFNALGLSSLGRALFNNLYIGSHNTFSLETWGKLLARYGCSIETAETYIPFWYAGIFDLSLRPESILFNFSKWQNLLAPINQMRWFEKTLFACTSAMVFLSRKTQTPQGINFFIVAVKNSASEESAPSTEDCCPKCRSPLRLQSETYHCTVCNRAYPVIGGIPLFLIPHESP